MPTLSDRLTERLASEVRAYRARAFQTGESGFLWYVEAGGIDTLTVAPEAPTEAHRIAEPQNLGWLTYEQAMARLTPVVWRLPVLSPCESASTYRWEVGRCADTGCVYPH